MISESPSSIYNYALQFCPASSWLHKFYSLELSQKVVVKGIQPEWGMCSHIVPLEYDLGALACWRDIVAFGYRELNKITIHNVITGVCVSVRSGCKHGIRSLAFSLDGIFLVSGGQYGTVNLWDMQTGGVVKTFHGHNDDVKSVSISLDCTMIASGSKDRTIRLWDTQTGECCCVIRGHKIKVNSVSFSPRSSQLLISASADDTVRLWDTSGCQIGPSYKGTCVTFSPDGACFLSWGSSYFPKRPGAILWNSDSGAVITKLPDIEFHCCCFSPDGRFVVGSDDQEQIYI